MKKYVFGSCPKYLGALTWNHPIMTLQVSGNSDKITVSSLSPCPDCGFPRVAVPEFCQHLWIVLMVHCLSTSHCVFNHLMVVRKKNAILKKKEINMSILFWI